MSQLTQEQGQTRVAIGAFIDRRRLVELARKEDRSVSAIVRRALTAELEREPKEKTRTRVVGTTSRPSFSRSCGGSWPR